MQKIRQPKQRASIQTKNQIIKATFQLFTQKGIHGINSKEIVELAGVSIGSFYSYFKNKKELLLEMLEEHLDQIHQERWSIMLKIGYDDLGEKTQMFIQNAFEAYKIDPEFHRQTHALRHSDPEINRLFERERNREIEQNRILLERNLYLPRGDKMDAAALLLQNLVESAIHTSIFLGPKIKKEDLIKQL